MSGQGKPQAGKEPGSKKETGGKAGAHEARQEVSKAAERQPQQAEPKKEGTPPAAEQKKPKGFWGWLKSLFGSRQS